MRKRLEAAKEEAAQWDPAIWMAQDHPNVMDPLILGSMLNDVSRLAWMVFKVSHD